MKIAVSGLGRAGRALVEHILEKTDLDIACAICRDASGSVGLSIGEAIGADALRDCPIVPISDARNLLESSDVDVLVDFSSQEFTRELFDLCAEKAWGFVVCTTDHDPNQLNEMRNAAREGSVGMVYAPNLTLGVNLLLEFARRLSKVLSDFDFAIVERHRSGKPPVSATARMIAEATGEHNAPIAYVRAGGYVGVHELTAANEYERITIEHESFSRAAFAYGALLAARFVSGKKGLFDMRDVINELEKEV